MKCEDPSASPAEAHPSVTSLTEAAKHQMQTETVGPMAERNNIVITSEASMKRTVVAACSQLQIMWTITLLCFARNSQDSTRRSSQCSTV